jgi:hypothetical protein
VAVRAAHGRAPDAGRGLLKSCVLLPRVRVISC